MYWVHSPNRDKNEPNDIKLENRDTITIISFRKWGGGGGR